MSATLLQLNEEIKKEADALLYEKGLLALLSSFGTPHVSGSYALDLMTWRDLDIYLEMEEMKEDRFFSLGGQLASLLMPVKMSFRNETIAKTPGLPDGFYWGIYLGNERKGDWKIDIWAIHAAECKRLLDYCMGIQEKLDKQKSARILAIKSCCWQDPEYRRSYSSMDIYTAVLDEGIRDMEGFERYRSSNKQ
jgi:hypothetical protein